MDGQIVFVICFFHYVFVIFVCFFLIKHTTYRVCTYALNFVDIKIIGYSLQYKKALSLIFLSMLLGPGEEEEEEEAVAEEATEEIDVVKEEGPAASDGEAEAVLEAMTGAVAEAAEVVAEEVETVSEEVAELVEEAAQAVAAEEPENNGTTSSSEEEAGATEA